MRIGLKLLLSDIVAPAENITWGDIIDNWEAYALEWQASNALAVVQTEAPLLDMFGDEGISIKSSLKDLSDPSKLFTDFSRSFTVPASKKNNMIFKHYYNIEIVGGLDSRELIPCRILINNTTYKVGNISIEGVEMSEGVPRSYKIRFIGKLSELSKRIGEDELSSLDFTSLNIPDFNPKGEFGAPAANDLVFPLASRSSRFLADSSQASLGIENAKNIRYVSPAMFSDYGINERDIVGALKVGKILDTIEQRYNINFTGVFTRDYIRSLYLWMHKPDKDRPGDPYSKMIGNISPTTPPALSDGRVVISSGAIAINSLPYHIQYSIRVKGVWTGGAILNIMRNGSVIASIDISNQWSLPIWITNESENQSNQSVGTFTFELQSFTTQTIPVTIELSEHEMLIPQGDIYIGIINSTAYTYTESVSIGTLGNYTINNHLPQMKVMDFLSSLFKMFNVVAEVSDTLDVSTRHFDAFMSEGVVHDYTRYINQEKYQVNRPNMYSSIKFGFEEAKVAQELGYKAVNGKDYGSLSYELTGSTGFKLSGSEYNATVKNQRIPLEPLYNLFNNNNTGIVYTSFADLKGAEQSIRPAFTYIATITGGTGLAWSDGLVTSEIVNYAQPTNVFNNNTVPNNVLKGTVGLYFGEELNEYNFGNSLVGLGLFSNFHKGLTAMMFDENARAVKFDSEIPEGKLLNLKLSDTLLISGKFYHINSIETNYLTGRSSLELTLVGRARLPYFEKKSFIITNTGGSDLRVTYINWNGFVADHTIISTGFSQIDCVGYICSISNPFYTISEV